MIEKNSFKNISYFIEYIFIRIFSFCLNLVPFGFSLWLARKVGSVLFFCLGARRRRALDNLTQALGEEKSQAEIKRLAKQCFQNMCMLFVEFIRISKINKNFERYVTIDHEEIVWQALQQEKGVLLIISHLGNWEFMSTMAGRIGYPIYALGRPMKNKWVYAYIKKMRGHTGLINIDKKERGYSALEIMRNIKKNAVIAILMDQHFWAEEGSVWVDFFGRKASTTSFPAQMALKLGCPVIPAFCLRSGREKYVINVKELVEIIRTGNEEKDIYDNTQHFIKIIEGEIRKHPEQWLLWLHNRWKKKPPTDNPNP